MLKNKSRLGKAETAVNRASEEMVDAYVMAWASPPRRPLISVLSAPASTGEGLVGFFFVSLLGVSPYVRNQLVWRTIYRIRGFDEVMQGQRGELWRVLCEQAATEQDPEKLLQIVRRINRLLDEKIVRQINRLFVEKEDLLRASQTRQASSSRAARC